MWVLIAITIFGSGLSEANTLRQYDSQKDCHTAEVALTIGRVSNDDWSRMNVVYRCEQKPLNQ